MTAAEAQRRRRVTVVVLVVTALGLAHHLDHVVRDEAGWPFTADVNPFTYSLAIYPVVAFELWQAARGRLLRGYRMTVAAVGFALVAVTHVGPLAADPVASVYASHRSPVAGAVAVAALVALLVGLVALFVVARGLRPAEPAPVGTQRDG